MWPFSLTRSFWICFQSQEKEEQEEEERERERKQFSVWPSKENQNSEFIWFRQTKKKNHVIFARHNRSRAEQNYLTHTFRDYYCLLRINLVAFWMISYSNGFSKPQRAKARKSFDHFSSSFGRWDDSHSYWLWSPSKTSTRANTTDAKRQKIAMCVRHRCYKKCARIWLYY